MSCAGLQNLGDSSCCKGLMRGFSIGPFNLNGQVGGTLRTVLSVLSDCRLSGSPARLFFLPPDDTLVELLRIANAESCATPHTCNESNKTSTILPSCMVLLERHEVLTLIRHYKDCPPVTSVKHGHVLLSCQNSHHSLPADSVCTYLLDGQSEGG